MDWSRFFHLSWADFQGEASRRTVILAVMAILLYQGAGIGYNLLKIELVRVRPAPAQAAAGTPAAAASVRETGDAYRPVVERNLFGTTTKAITDKQAGNLQQDISLLVDLKGTVAGDGNQGFAIIEEKGTRKQRLVKVGGIVSGAKVVAIKRNILELLIDGQVRVLKIVETKEASILPPAPAAAVAPVAEAGGAIVINRSEVGASLQDMGSMLRQAQVRPFFSAGVQEGFMVTNIQPGSLYQRMGVVEGDVIQKVDNRNIRTADDMVMLFNTLKNASAMSLGIRRAGKEEALNYQFR